MQRYFFILFFLVCSFLAWPQAGSNRRYQFTDSAITAASNSYQTASFLHTILMGRNYRQQWQTKVTVPLFRLSASPFSILTLGGGMQTKSLQLRDTASKVWLLRTVDKDVTDAVPKLLRNTVAHKALQDQISSALPYGALVVGELAYAAGILAARPQIVMVAEDQALDSLNTFFAGKLCMLEERDPGFDSTFITEDVLNSLQQSSLNRVHQKAYLKARLLDMLIGDWDRHPGNWRWGRRDSAGFRWWIPIPRDRDWAFYKSGGALPWLAQQTRIQRHLVSFGATPKKFTDQAAKAWALDQFFLNELEWTDWEEGIRQLQASLTDAAIVHAVKTLPPAIYTDLGNTLIKQLKSRRDALLKAVKKYYQFQSKAVVLEVSNQAEKILISADDSSFEIETLSDGKQVYQRRFYATETTSITINCIKKGDVFMVRDTTSSTLRRVDDGKGKQTFQLNNKVRVKLVYSQP